MADVLKTLREGLIGNWWLKLFSLLLAIISFYAIRGAISFEVPYDIPVDVQVEKGIAILDQNPRSVAVTFRGSQDNVRLLDPQQIRAAVRARATDPDGSERIPIGPADFRGARDVRVVSVRPSSVAVLFDRETSRDVAVAAPKTIGKPMLGTVRVEIQPATVRIRGPRRRLEAIMAVNTEPIDVDGRVESFETRVRVLPPGDQGVARIEPPEVTARVTIITEAVSRTLTNVVVYAISRPGERVSARVEPPAVNVVLQGRAEEIDNMEAQSLQVFVNTIELEPQVNYELPVQIHLPPGVEATATADPKTVKTTVTRR